MGFLSKLFGFSEAKAERPDVEAARELLKPLWGHVGVYTRGICTPDWEALVKAIGDRPESEQSELWNAIPVAWMGEVATALGEEYWLVQQGQVLLLTDEEPQHAVVTLREIHRVRRRILDALAGIATDYEHGAHVILCFNNADGYYRYCDAVSTSHVPSSGGIFFNRGYSHIAVNALVGSPMCVLSHEMAHSMVAELPLPLWLNEGPAMMMESHITGSTQFALDAELMERHADFWNGDRIQGFWTGEIWGEDGLAQELSYSLAAKLLEHVTHATPSPKQASFREFVLAADWEDAGDGACRKVLGLSLGKLAARFLGPGNWAPADDLFPEYTALQA